jgi:tetratricopeptide (TPR) repeat protein
MVYCIIGRHAEAGDVLDRIETEAQRLGDRTELAEIRMTQATLAAMRSQYDDAARMYHQAHTLFEQIGNAPAAAECLLEQGWLALRDHAPAAASLFQSAAPILAEHPHHAWRVAYGLARCAEVSGDPDQALRRYRAAISTVGQLRWRLASERLSSALYSQAAQLHADAGRLAAATNAIELLLEFGEKQRALVLQRMLTAHTASIPHAHHMAYEVALHRINTLLVRDSTLLGDLHTAIDTALEQYAEMIRDNHLTDPEPSDFYATDAEYDLNHIRRRLCRQYGDDWTGVIYILNEPALFIITLTPQGLDIERAGYDTPLQRLIAQATRADYRHYVYRDLPYHNGTTRYPWACLRELAERLLPPTALARLHPTHRLLIVPAGPLHALPWAALRPGGTWLAERAIIQIAPTLAIYQALATRPPVQADAALLIGCSTFDDRAPTLPAVADELTLVAAHWPGTVTCLYNAEASRDALMTRSAQGELLRYSLLYIAGHAQLLTTQGLDAYIRLWDDDLLLPDVVGLRLNRALVTLSACEGAAPSALPGDEVLSLSWALLAAGASGVLASLWPIHDNAALRFMAAFYQALHIEHDAALALASAQRTLIRAHQTSADPVDEPLVWGSFILTGAMHILQ